MLKKTIRRLGALAMVLAMAVSVFAVNASAAGGLYEGGESGLTSITMTKKLTVGANALTPAATATFSVTPANADQVKGGKSVTVKDETKTYPVNIGVAGGLTFATGKDTVTFAQGQAKVDNTDYAQQQTALTVDKSKFTAPGIYRYVVTETSVTGDGVAKDDSTYYVDLYVENDGDNGYKVVSAEALKVGANSNEKSDLEFNNEYTSNTLTVTKKVEGAMGDKTHKWEIAVTVYGTDTNKTFATSYPYPAGEGTGNVVLKSGEKYTFKLADTEKVEIYGLSAGDKYIVDETDAKVDTDNYDVIGEELGTDGEATATISQATTVTIINTRNAATPGGVIMTIAPYALMVVLAGAFAVVFLSRRNRAE